MFGRNKSQLFYVFWEIDKKCHSFSQSFLIYHLYSVLYPAIHTYTAGVKKAFQLTFAHMSLPPKFLFIFANEARLVDHLLFSNPLSHSSSVLVWKHIRQSHLGLTVVSWLKKAGAAKMKAFCFWWIRPFITALLISSPLLLFKFSIFPSWWNWMNCNSVLNHSRRKLGNLLCLMLHWKLILNSEQKQNVHKKHVRLRFRSTTVSLYSFMLIINRIFHQNLTCCTLKYLSQILYITHSPKSLKGIRCGN